VFHNSADAVLSHDWGAAARNPSFVISIPAVIDASALQMALMVVTGWLDVTRAT
jgi:hypothetical protein